MLECFLLRIEAMMLAIHAVDGPGTIHVCYSRAAKLRHSSAIHVFNGGWTHMLFMQCQTVVFLCYSCPLVHLPVL